MCVPTFHALGFMQSMVGIGLGSTLVVRRRFDPEATLDSLERHKATAMVVVPVMLQRMLDVGEDEIDEHDLSNLRIIFVSGSALGVELAKRALKAFGPVIYNLYGSTEIAYATIATPDDLEGGARLGRQGRSRLGREDLDDDGKHELPQGETGRIFVGNQSQFEGYTGGGSKDEVDGLMSTGDVGHFDEKGRLFIDGRDDEMIVSGGENVFPAEVEELLSGHEAIEEAAVIGVDDEKFGQRLKAFVVLRSGAQPERGRGQGLRQGEPRRATRPRARSCSSTSCRATRPARCSSASSPGATTTPRTTTPSQKRPSPRTRPPSGVRKRLESVACGSSIHGFQPREV